jgi:hypothetical protein
MHTGQGRGVTCSSAPVIWPTECPAFGNQRYFALPIDAARCKAREIIHQSPKSGYVATVQDWRQLPDGQIEFMMRLLPTL